MAEPDRGRLVDPLLRRTDRRPQLMQHPQNSVRVNAGFLRELEDVWIPHDLMMAQAAALVADVGVRRCPRITQPCA